MKACIECGSSMRSEKKADICKGCASVCECGTPKDFRAKACKSCSMSRKGKALWTDPAFRKKMAEARSRQVFVHRTFSDLRAEHFAPRPEGRWIAMYYDATGRQRTIYRYQWVWRLAHGDIPRGHHIHHRNHDKSDDRPENLVCMTPREHLLHHAPEFVEKALAARGLQRVSIPTWQCQQCGAAFSAKRREGGRARRYCSQDCRIAAQRTDKNPQRQPTKGRCKRCGAEFIDSPAHANRRTYCTRACMVAAFSKAGSRRDQARQRLASV